MILMSGLASCNKLKTLTLQTSNQNCCDIIPSFDIKEIVKQNEVLSQPVFTHLVLIMAVKKCGCLPDEEAKEKCFNQFKLK